MIEMTFLHVRSILKDSLRNGHFLSRELYRCAADIGGQRQWKAGQADNGQFFFWNSESRQEDPDRHRTTFFLQSFGQKRDKGMTRTVLSADVWCAVIHVLGPNCTFKTLEFGLLRLLLDSSETVRHVNIISKSFLRVRKVIQVGMRRNIHVLFTKKSLMV